MLGLNTSCEIEQSAYDYDDLVFKDQSDEQQDLRGADGVFSLVDNCPNRFNPGQEDSDGDGVGDVCDGTNQSDILWRHVDGTVAIWHDALPDWTEWPGALDHYWQIQGVGDFDGDGHSDILWRAVTGQVAYWSAGWLHGVWTGIMNHDWQIQGVGDFDGDGRGDILWRHLNLSPYYPVVWPSGRNDAAYSLPLLDLN